MENKHTLVSLVLGFLMVCMAGCQMLSNDPNVAQAAVEANQAQLPAIQDELILDGWNTLREMKEPIQLDDGVVVSGESLAQFLVESQIPVVWGGDEICGGSSCSKQYCTLDGDCSYEDGQPGIDPIYLNASIQAQKVGMLDRLAGELAHEALHRLQVFGSGKITQIEEYWAFYLDAHLVKADYPVFSGVDPQDPEQLAAWFTIHGLRGYLRLDPYPGVPAPVVQVKQSALVAEDVAQE